MWKVGSKWRNAETKSTIQCFVWSALCSALLCIVLPCHCIFMVAFFLHFFALFLHFFCIFLHCIFWIVHLHFPPPPVLGQFGCVGCKPTASCLVSGSAWGRGWGRGVGSPHVLSVPCQPEGGDRGYVLSVAASHQSGCYGQSPGARRGDCLRGPASARMIVRYPISHQRISPPRPAHLTRPRLWASSAGGVSRVQAGSFQARS